MRLLSLSQSRLLQVQANTSSPLVYSVETTKLADMDDANRTTVAAASKKRRVQAPAGGERAELERAIATCETRIPMHILSQDLVIMGILHTASMATSRILLLLLPHPEGMVQLKNMVDSCHMVADAGGSYVEVRFKADRFPATLVDMAITGVAGQSVAYDAETGLAKFVYTDVTRAVADFVNDWVGACAIFEAVLRVSKDRGEMPRKTPCFVCVCARGPLEHAERNAGALMYRSRHSWVEPGPWDAGNGETGNPETGCRFAFTGAKFTIPGVQSTDLLLSWSANGGYTVAFMCEGESALAMAADKIAEEATATSDLVAIIKVLPQSVAPLEAIKVTFPSIDVPS